MPPSYMRVRAVGVRPRTDRHTDACDHNTFCVVYDLCKMELGIERVHVLANILRSRCCQNASSGSPQSRPPQ